MAIASSMPGSVSIMILSIAIMTLHLCCLFILCCPHWPQTSPLDRAETPQQLHRFYHQIYHFASAVPIHPTSLPDNAIANQPVPALLWHGQKYHNKTPQTHDGILPLPCATH